VTSQKTPLFNQSLFHEDVWESGYIDPCFLDFGTTWRWVVSFRLRPLYSRGKRPWYTWDKLDWSQSRFGWHGEIKILDPTMIRTLTLRSSSRWSVAIPTTLSRFLNDHQPVELRADKEKRGGNEDNIRSDEQTQTDTHTDQQGDPISLFSFLN
jgi:hypothetical protein